MLNGRLYEPREPVADGEQAWGNKRRLAAVSGDEGMAWAVMKTRAVYQRKGLSGEKEMGGICRPQMCAEHQILRSYSTRALLQIPIAGPAGCRGNYIGALRSNIVSSRLSLFWHPSWKPLSLVFVTDSPDLFPCYISAVIIHAQVLLTISTEREPEGGTCVPHYHHPGDECFTWPSHVSCKAERQHAVGPGFLSANQILVESTNHCHLN